MKSHWKHSSTDASAKQIYVITMNKRPSHSLTPSFTRAASQLSPSSNSSSFSYLHKSIFTRFRVLLFPWLAKNSSTKFYRKKWSLVLCQIGIKCFCVQRTLRQVPKHMSWTHSAERNEISSKRKVCEKQKYKNNRAVCWLWSSSKIGKIAVAAVATTGIMIIIIIIMNGWDIFLLSSAM